MPNTAAEKPHPDFWKWDNTPESLAIAREKLACLDIHPEFMDPMTLSEIARLAGSQFQGLRGLLSMERGYTSVVTLGMAGSYDRRHEVEQYLQERVPHSYRVRCVPLSRWQWLTCWTLKVVR